MLPIKTLIKRIRRVVHDTDAITYDDDEILAVVNQGVRSIRRIIADNKPEMLAEKVITGVVEAGTQSIELPYRPMVFLYVRAGDEIAKSEERSLNAKIYHNYNLIYKNPTPLFSGKETIITYRTRRIQEANLSEIYGDINREGTPEVYYVTGDRTVNLYPVPKANTGYDILVVQDFDELTIEDDTPLLNEFDDLLLEYANVRLSVENEYDVSADSQIMSTIQAQIMRLLHIPPTGVTVQGYWGPTMEQYGKPTRRRW
ncbi:hypothetical protein [Selenomonas sp. AE3005]|uniref:phage adaptor protein n=1 Tax=Selenomonas sp. AE3005 TaxID=1485543 RepID=UPI0025FEFBA4|nr:hypothetical protein [Selenomonas sp. AE3005]